MSSHQPLERKKYSGFDFDGYWEDIGTIRSFYDVNLALTGPNPPFNFFDQTRPIYSRARFLPGSTIENSVFERVMLTDGCCIQNAEIRHSIIGLRSQIRAGVRIIDSVIMGADYYDRDSAINMGDQDGLVNGEMALGIGKGSHIEGAIIDKNTRIGKSVIIKPFPRGTDIEEDLYYVRDGIVVVPKKTVIPDGTYIGPDSTEE